ncbi:MAG TPA: glutamate--tRNA ligase [Bacteroidales bacterium]|nr:glutamate--tRNA ligase [Bacteroidales bacterium]
MNDQHVRVRFAPSPTGPLHMGGVRTALFNYLFAKKHGGDFLLRIEDTDQTRYVTGAEQYIIDSLQWCGLKPDEGVEQGGPHAPYRQSERKDIYRRYADQLLISGNAYYAFDTPEELDEIRKSFEAEKKTFAYNAVERLKLKNSLTLSEAETQQLLATGAPFVVRFKMPENEEIVLQDLIRGEVKFNTVTLDDKVLFKSDGLPTYHLANVVDDYLMEITHVIRGEEWLPSLPLHALLYRSLGWKSSMPAFAHLPLILKPSGQGKLSKRDGDKLGFPVFPLEWKDPVSNEISTGYRETGYFPEAFVNILALLGWNPGTEQEVFSLDELIQAFSLERVGKSGSRFDPEKARWFNQQFLRNRSNMELAEIFAEELNQKGIASSMEYIENVIDLVKERVEFAKDFWGQAWYFFTAPDQYDEKVVKKRWKEGTGKIMLELSGVLDQVELFEPENIKSAIETFVNERSLGFGLVMNALRLALVGGSMGADLVTMVSMLGKGEVKERINKAVQTINK